MANPPKDHRRKELERRAAHEAAQAEYVGEYKRSHGPPENKALPGAPENKVARFDAAALEEKSKDELVGLAETAGVEVAREDGRTDLAPTKADYVRALAG